MPIALFVIGLLSVGAAAILGRGSTEAQVNESAEAELDALALAETGLHRFVTGRASLGLTASPPAALENVTINLPGGRAEVELRRIRPKTATEEAIYVVKSRGIRTAGATAWNPAAEHTVAQYAFFREGSMQVMAGWTSLSGITKNGTSGTISGVDSCGAMADVAGVAVPTTTAVGTPGYDQQGGSYPMPTGSPPVDYVAPDPTGMASLVKIDWDGIVNHNAIIPDVTINTSSDPFPSATTFASNPNYWPVIRINDPNYSIPNGGRGTLIATGDLTINGGLQWHGIVLVGGNLTANGTNTVLGATVSGLNVKLGLPVPVQSIGNGTKVYQYDSCNVAAALAGFATLVAIPGTWADNWMTW